MGAVAAGAILTGVLLLVVALLVWQSSRRSPVVESPTYVLDDAARFVHGRLDQALSLSDVYRILEWGLYHKQVVAARRDDRPVVGGEDAIGYIGERARDGAGRHFRVDQIRSVLTAETAYLLQIGAIGEPVGEESGP